MINEKIENFCKITQNIYSEDKIITTNIICNICERLITNACNGLCGCIFCWGCIEIYLDGKEKCCPGKLSECGNQILRIEDNILINQSVHSQISRIIVKCPEQSGRNLNEYKEIEDSELKNDEEIQWSPLIDDFKVSEMVNGETNEQTKFLIECFKTLKQEINSIKLNVLNLKKENQELIQEIEIVKIDVRKKQAHISSLQKKNDRKTQQIEYLLQKLKLSNEDIDTDKETESSDKDYFNEKIDHLNKKILKLEMNLERQNYGEFLWVVDNFSQKISEARKGINREIYSDSFYSHKNGYKMCLQLDLGGTGSGRASHLAIYFCIMRGPFDEILPWPMRHAVTFALINQHTSLIHSSKTVRYDDVPDNFAWNKPNSDKKTGFGYHKFIAMDDLLNNSSLCQNDQIFIACSVYIV